MDTDYILCALINIHSILVCHTVGKFGEHYIWRIGKKTFNFGDLACDPLTQYTKCYIGEL